MNDPERDPGTGCEVRKGPSSKTEPFHEFSIRLSLRTLNRSNGKIAKNQEDIALPEVSLRTAPADRLRIIIIYNITKLYIKVNLNYK